MDKNQTFNGGGTVIQKFNETTFRSKLIELSLPVGGINLVRT